jgi:hypothetical protein
MADLVRDSILEHLLPDVLSALDVCDWYDQRDKRRVLLHNDFAVGNIIVATDARLAGVIDWTNAYIGPAYREYRHIALVDPEFGRQITPAHLWPAVKAAAFLRGVRLYLCEPERPVRQSELARVLRENRTFDNRTLISNEKFDELISSQA